MVLVAKTNISVSAARGYCEFIVVYCFFIQQFGDSFSKKLIIMIQTFLFIRVFALDS